MVGPLTVRLIDPDGRELEATPNIAMDPYPRYDQLHLHLDLTRPEQHAYAAAEWIAGHWHDFVNLMAYMHRQVDQGNPRTTRDDVIAWARSQSVEMSDVANVVRDHNLWAGVARYMVMLRPRLLRTINFRHSGLDDIDLVTIWRDVVNKSTTFYARDIEEARRLLDMGDASAQ